MFGLPFARGEIRFRLRKRAWLCAHSGHGSTCQGSDIKRIEHFRQDRNLRLLAQVEDFRQAEIL